MMVELREITRDNWKDCVRLKVAEDQQGFVASNAVSLAQSKYEPDYVPTGVYDGEKMVGFIMYAPGDHNGEKCWFIDRLMVGKDYQHKGYGRAAMQNLLAHLKAQPGYAAIYISFVPENEPAKNLYASLGFQDTGEIDDGEIVYRLPV